MALHHLFRSGSVVLALSWCTEAAVPRMLAAYDQYTAEDLSIGKTPTNEPVEYKVTFTNNWTQENHRNQYPGGAHWSAPVFVSHNTDYDMWFEGGKATPGIENVAETGSTSRLIDEINDRGGQTLSMLEGKGQGAGPGQKQVIPDGMCVNGDHPLISAIAMIAPSPDWFSGVHDFVPADEGFWYERVTLAVYPWDAGTEEGSSYSLSNPDQSPQDLISGFSVDDGAAVFVTEGENGRPNHIKPVAFITLEQIETSRGCSATAGSGAEGAGGADTSPTNLSDKVRVARKRKAGKKGKRARAGKVRARSCTKWVEKKPVKRCSLTIADGAYAGMLVEEVCRKSCFGIGRS